MAKEKRASPKTKKEKDAFRKREQRRDTAQMIPVMYKNEKYFIVPQSAILMIERDEELF